ncbi:MAG: sensor domain-containing diguanylate cyclase [Leptolyngbyaceae bacterium]|nr:sensor domain-containing diguanylate cyclase [Leptolyngbyaceae bacterium]
MTNYYCKLFEIYPDACLITTASGSIQNANPAAEALLGQPLEELRGKPFLEFLLDTDQERYQQRITYLAQTPVDFAPWNMSIQRQDGTMVNVQAIAVRNHDSDDQVLCWCLQNIQEGQAIAQSRRKTDREFDAAVKEETRQLTQITKALQEKLRLLKQQQKSLKNQISQEQLIETIAQRIYECVGLDELLDTTVSQVRLFLRADRVILYRFKPDWSGTVTVESIAPGVMPILYTYIDEPCFRDQYVSLYAQGRVRAIEDINQAGLNPCHHELLANFGVRANLVVPVLREGNLWGLLIAHHCRSTRHWKEDEIKLLSKLAIQFGIAVYQAELYQKWQSLATKDSLTGLANRYHFDAYLDECWQYHQINQLPLTLVLADIDFFKQYNDTYGHPAGDECLKQVATAMQATFSRSQDLIARYGGEEFAFLLPETDADGVLERLAILRQQIQALGIKHEASEHGRVTLSFGIASLIPQMGEVSSTLIDAADQALYQAKGLGRNRIALSSSVT